MRVVSVATTSSCVVPLDSGYAKPMPEAVCPGSAQGAAPNVIETLKTFFPEARGKMLPDRAQLRLVIPLSTPVPETVKAIVSVVKVLRVHEPEIVVSDGAVL